METFNIRLNIPVDINGWKLSVKKRVDPEGVIVWWTDYEGSYWVLIRSKRHENLKRDFKWSLDCQNEKGYEYYFENQEMASQALGQVRMPPNYLGW